MIASIHRLVELIGLEWQPQRILTKIVEHLHLIISVSKRQGISTAAGHIGFSEGQRVLWGILE